MPLKDLKGQDFSLKRKELSKLQKSLQKGSTANKWGWGQIYDCTFAGALLFVLMCYWHYSYQGFLFSYERSGEQFCLFSRILNSFWFFF
jgi:magnesium-transporting ATPase (P-type)